MTLTTTAPMAKSLPRLSERPKGSCFIDANRIAQPPPTIAENTKVTESGLIPNIAAAHTRQNEIHATQPLPAGATAASAAGRQKQSEAIRIARAMLSYRMPENSDHQRKVNAPMNKTMAVTANASHRQIRADLFTKADERMVHPTVSRLFCCDKELDEQPEAHRCDAATRKTNNRWIRDSATLCTLFE